MYFSSQLGSFSTFGGEEKIIQKTHFGVGVGIDEIVGFDTHVYVRFRIPLFVLKNE